MTQTLEEKVKNAIVRYGRYVAYGKMGGGLNLEAAVNAILAAIEDEMPTDAQWSYGERQWNIRLSEALSAAISRLETIAETNDEIRLEDDLAYLRGVPLAGRPFSTATPPDTVTVPREPTEAMVEAGIIGPSLLGSTE